jgi:hypothetical protein
LEKRERDADKQNGLQRTIVWAFPVLGQTGYIDDGIRADAEQLVKDRWARLSDQDKDGCRKLMVILGLANVIVN